MAKTKVLISSAVTAQLICVFVLAYAKSRFSHDKAHILKYQKTMHNLGNSKVFVFRMFSVPFWTFFFQTLATDPMNFLFLILVSQ